MCAKRSEIEEGDVLLGRLGFLVLIATLGMNAATEGAFAQYDLWQRLLIASLGGATAGAMMRLGHRFAATVGGVMTTVCGLLILQAYLWVRGDNAGRMEQFIIQYIGVIPGLVTYVLIREWLAPTIPLATLESLRDCPIS